MNCQKSRELAYKIRLHALEMTSRGGTSHIASIFSMADLVAVLYADVLRYDPNNPRMPERDRLILSKGHAGADPGQPVIDLSTPPLKARQKPCAFPRPRPVCALRLQRWVHSSEAAGKPE